MRPATRPPPRRDDVGLVIVDGEAGASRLGQVGDLVAVLDPGDVLVLNDAATFPASLSLSTAAGEAVEIRLIEERPGGFFGLAFGAGDWRTPTENRPPAPELAPGTGLHAGSELVATVRAVDPRSARLVELRFEATDPWEPIYRLGRPIQYAYLEDDEELWTVQTAYGSRPVAAEMASAGRPLSWAILGALRRRGVELGWLTHAAGLSSTGDVELDALLPLPERYQIPSATAAAVRRARARGSRVIGAGTTVVRALESAARAGDGDVVAGAGRTDLVIDASTELLAVDGIITGLHEPDASHHRLLRAFAGTGDLETAWARAAAAGFRAHELGDVAIVGPGFAGAIRALGIRTKRESSRFTCE